MEQQRSGGDAAEVEARALLALLASNNIPCPACGYGLGGLGNLRCPECGLEITEEILSPPRRPDAAHTVSVSIGLSSLITTLATLGLCLRMVLSPTGPWDPIAGAVLFGLALFVSLPIAMCTWASMELGGRGGAAVHWFFAVLAVACSLAQLRLIVAVVWCV